MEKEEPTERLFSESEAAAMLGMSPRMLANRRRARKIEHVRDGRYYIRYRQRDIDGYLSKFATTPFVTAPTAHTQDSATRRSAPSKPATKKPVLSPEEAKTLKMAQKARSERAQERHIQKYGITRQQKFFLEYFKGTWPNGEPMTFAITKRNKSK
jgi:hypothetical protein